MTTLELNWLNMYGEKICRDLRQEVVECHKPVKYIPSFMNKLIHKIKKRLIKVDVIVQATEEIGTKHQFKKKQDLPIINGFCAKMSIKDIETVIGSESLKKIWADRKVYAVNDIARKVVRVNYGWRKGYSGKGIGVAVIDTGIYKHPDLVISRSRIIGFKDFVKGKTKPYDDNGHGTHVAGTIAGNGRKSGKKYSGMAPSASLIGVKVLDKYGSGKLSNVIKGIQWCIENKKKYNIRVINLSLGANAVTSHKHDPVCQAVEMAWDSGLCVCAAAGNQGPDYRTIGSPGIHPEIITVGATDDRNTRRIGDDKVAYFSSRGPTIDGLIKPDLVAPGSNIISLRSPSSYLDKTLANKRVGKFYISMSGTSMATPVVSGLVAIMIQAKPSLTPREIKRLLQISCKSLGYKDIVEGKGLVNIEKAMNLLK